MSAPEAHFFDDSNLKQLLRKLVQDKGQPVKFEERWNGELEVSSYGWMDYDAYHHIKGFGEDEKGCSWIIEEEATLTEVTYSLFDGTDCDNINEPGINIYPARCGCGKYQDMHLRYADSLGSILRYLLSNDGRGISI